MINNGIINMGDNNINTISASLSHEEIMNELRTLEQNSKEDLEDIIKSCENKDFSALKKLSTGSIHLIKKLGLKTLETLIEKLILY